jgi:protein-S-isoprenylcysteine O-methyltransferase Ste14
MMIVAWPPALVFWLVVHPAIALWRRVGYWLSYSVVTLAMAAVGALGYYLSDEVIGSDLGFVPILVAPALLSYGVAVLIYAKRRRHLTNRILTGVPELQADGRGGELLTEGIYSRMRHPRYVELSLATLALTLFVNHVGTYVLCVVFFIGLQAVVLLEERELLQRFGEDYAAYQARVPRFIPHRS